MAKSSSVAPPPQTSSRPIVTRYRAVLCALLLLLTCYYWLPRSFSDHDDEYHRYEGETLLWKGCGNIENRKLECTSIEVPLDHFNASNQSNSTFVLPIIRLRGLDGSKNMFMSPGGPGVSGVSFLHNRGAQLHTIIGSGFHLIAFDSRGVNGSKPQALCYPTRKAKSSLSIPQFQPFDRSPDAYAWTKGFVQSCRDLTGEHGPYINTPQTAADMNTMLEALGQTEMIYWGISYGSVLGQTYATMFPERAFRIIIDGVINNAWYYENLFSGGSSLYDTERVLFGFFQECIKARDLCSLSRLANTAEELQDRVLRFVKSLTEPIDIYVDASTWGILRYEDMFYTAIFGSLYAPLTWSTLADKLMQLLQGNATESFLTWAGKGPYDDWMTTEAYHFISLNDGPTGASNWPQDRREFLQLIMPILDYTMFSPALHLEAYKLQQWLIPKTHNFIQNRTVNTAHPLLIMSTEWDPATPYEDALSALKVFEGSRLVKLTAYGHTTFAMPSKCVAEQVRNYLYQGDLPEEGFTCEPDIPYFTSAGATAPRFMSTESQAVYRSQLALARDLSSLGLHARYP